MRLFFPSIAAGALALSGLLFQTDAQACGACFHVIGAEPSQVIGHRMIFSISNERTTLWDQLEYSGNPEEFAWVLPIHGQVEIGLSSDALFGQLESLTTPRVLRPDINCGSPYCPEDDPGTVTTTSTSSPNGGGVTIIAQETVGPYETVQLSSADPMALEDWLDAHGYEVSADMVPVITDYVNEGFDFLAMKLVPGKDVTSMVPVRVTSPGAGLSLPLRMVAGGAGAITPLTLWIVGEGRYEAANFPTFEIDPDKVLWNWDSDSSNYAQLKQLGFDATNKRGWLAEATLENSFSIDQLTYAVEAEWDISGYGETQEEAVAGCAADLDALHGSIDPGSFWVTRLHAELPKAELATDLIIGAAANQSPVTSVFYPQKTVGTKPECPAPPVCEGSTSGSGGGNGTGAGDGSGAGNGNGGSGAEDGGSGGGCSVGGSAPPVGAAIAALALAAALRRKRRSL